MNITCPHCSAKMNLPDDRIPRERDASFKCPKCKESIRIKALRQETAPASSMPGKEEFTQGNGLFRKVSKVQALICMGPSPARNRILGPIQRAGYGIDLAEDPDQAFQKLEYHVYPLMVMDDRFDRDGAMAGHMNELDMSQRRKICLIRVSQGVETGNAMAALHASVNFVIRTRDLEQEDEIYIEEVLAAALAEQTNFYRVYNDSMIAAGKA